MSTHTQTSNDVTTLTISAAARYLECSEKSIRRRIQSGDLPASMINGAYRIRQADLDAMPAIATRGARRMSPADVVEWAREIARTAPPLTQGRAEEVARILQGVA